jgi:hypothetical protein
MGISVNSTNALLYFTFFGCDVGILGAAWIWSHDFWSIWDFVALGSGVSREISRIYFWNLTNNYRS